MPFLLGFFALLLIVLAPIVSVNVLIDVTGVYRRNHATELLLARDYAKRLIASRGGLLWEPRERAVKIEFARQSEANCYVTGSSREMQIDRHTVPELEQWCPTLANLGTSGAGIEDFFTMLGIIVAKGKPATVVMGVAPWSLRYNADRGWQQFPEIYAQSRTRLGLSARSDGDWSRARLAAENLLSFAYFRRNLEWMQARGSFLPVEAPVHEDEWGPDDSVLRPTGILVPSKNAQSQPPPPDIAVGVRDPRVGRPFVSPALLSDLEHAIDFARSMGIRFIFILPPFHPQTLRCRSIDFCSAIEEVRKSILELARRNASPVLGDFDPACCGVTRDDFYDYTHLRASGLRKIRALRR